jgi:hypothetical protein
MDDFTFGSNPVEQGAYKKYFRRQGSGFAEVEVDVENHVAPPAGEYGVEILSLSKPFEMSFVNRDTGKQDTAKRMRAELRILQSPVPGWEGHRTSILLPVSDLTIQNTLGRLFTAITGERVTGEPVKMLDVFLGGKFGVALSRTPGSAKRDGTGNYPDRTGFDYKTIVPIDKVRTGAPPPPPAPGPAAATAELDDVPF